MTSGHASQRPSSVWRHRDFLFYLGGQATSVGGSSVSSVALPLLAVAQLHADAGQVALLAFLRELPAFLGALHAGAWADRRPKRPLIILGDLVAAATLISLPAAAAFATVTLAQLYAVALLLGIAKTVGDAASVSYLPALMDRSLLQQSNSKIGGLYAVAATGGSNLGAVLVGALGAARAVSADALSYLVSAWCITRIRTPEPAPVRKPGRLLGEIGEGLKYVWNVPLIRSLTLVNATVSFALGMMNTYWAYYLISALHLGPAGLGAVMGVGGLGSCAGALLAPRIARRTGPGRMMLAGLALTPLTQIPLLLAGPGRGWQMAVGAALVVQLFCAASLGTTQRSVRQLICEPRYQGRMQQTSTWLCTGSRPLAALLAGASASLIGVRPTLIVGAALLAGPFAVAWFSPIRTLRAIPAIPSPTTPGPAVPEGAAL
ncbi:MFS transporter [Streptomyces sp. NPDC059373]